MKFKNFDIKTAILLILPFVAIFIYGKYFGPHPNELMRLCEASELKDIDKVENYAERTERFWSTVNREIKSPAYKEFIQGIAHDDSATKEEKIRRVLKNQGVEVPLVLCPALRELIRQ